MKLRMILLFCLLVMSQYVRSTIVFVHLGPRIPAYLYVALEQARLFNPDVDICLIANQQAIDASSYDFTKNRLTTVLCESLARTKEHTMFVRRCPHSDTVLDGFWRKAIERFFYLHEYITARDLKKVIHLESDNMLYVEVATLLGAFSKYKGLGAVFDFDNRCIPSLVYIANESAIYNLVQFLSAHASENTFDMAFLALYKNTSTPDKIDNLPLIMPEYVEKYSLTNVLGQKPTYPESYTRNHHLFKSIFDGAAIGQFLGGIDPNVHAESEPGFINETCVFNPSHLVFEWRKDEQGRRVPFAVCEGAANRINNLHIHSKRLHDFRS